jgi:hypothetical protein
VQEKRRGSRAKGGKRTVKEAPLPVTAPTELADLRSRAGRLRYWETEGQTATLLVYYQFAKAVHDFCQAGGSVREAMTAAQVEESSIRRAKAVGGRPFEWFHERWTFRSSLGERLTRRHIETLATAPASKGKAALEEARTRIGGSRKMETAVRRKKPPLREEVAGDAPKALRERSGSGTLSPDAEVEGARSGGRTSGKATRAKKKSSSK